MRLMRLLMLLCLSVVAMAQNYTTVTSSKFSDASGKLLNGQICFTPAIPFEIGGGGISTNAPVCSTVVNGAVTLQLANPANTTPANISYALQVTPNGGSPYTCPSVQFSGASFNLDNFVCPSITTAALGGSTSGPLVVNGNLTVTGSIQGASIANIISLPTPPIGDATALIQAAITNGTQNGSSVKILLGPGTWNILGPQINCDVAGTQTGQIAMPAINESGALSNPFVTVDVEGYVPSTLNFSGVAAANATILQTNSNGSANNLFCGKASTTGGNSGFTSVRFVLNNVTLRSYVNPNVTMVNATWIAQSNIKVLCDTGALPNALPTNSNGRCVVTPGSGNAADSTLEAAAYGYYTSFDINEHETAVHLTVGYCVNAVRFGPGGHGVWIGMLNAEECPNIISPISSSQFTSGIKIGLLDVEHDSGTFANVCDICDSSNVLAGSVGWWENNSSGFASPTIQGGAIFYPQRNEIDLGGNSASSPFSSLGAPLNSFQIYCSDCKNVIDDAAVAGAACVGSGHGSNARRENGHWACN
jgi:hypothetical protein